MATKVEAPKGKAEGIVKLGDHDYQKVGLRLKLMHEEHPDWTVSTEIVSLSDDKAVMRAQIADEHGRVRGTGHAEKWRVDPITGRKTTPLEFCETKAVGRALANAGWAGVDIASAEEMDEWRSEKIVEYFLRHNELVRKHWVAITLYKKDIKDELDREKARDRLRKRVGDEEEYIAIWKAPSKGGIFTTFERDRHGSAAPPEDAVEDPDAPVTHPKMDPPPWIS